MRAGIYFRRTEAVWYYNRMEWAFELELPLKPGPASSEVSPGTLFLNQPLVLSAPVLGV